VGDSIGYDNVVGAEFAVVSAYLAEDGFGDRNVGGFVLDNHAWSESFAVVEHRVASAQRTVEGDAYFVS
jgi:hypothetical protein